MLLELADVYAKKKDTKEAIEYQQKAFGIYRTIESIEPKILGSIAIKLSELYERAEQIPEAIDALRQASVEIIILQAEQIYEKSLGNANKQTCKIKRNISLLMLKANKYQDALAELLIVEVHIS